VTLTFNLRRERVHVRSQFIKPNSQQKLNVDGKSLTIRSVRGLLNCIPGTVDKLQCLNLAVNGQWYNSEVFPKIVLTKSQSPTVSINFLLLLEYFQNNYGAVNESMLVAWTLFVSFQAPRGSKDARTVPD